MADIVVIEDDLLTRNMIVDTLRVEGYNPKGVGQGNLGVQIVREWLPDLVLCDVGIPGMDGYKVLQELRQDSRTRTLPFIFLTARDRVEDMRRGMELGADDYIFKPFSPPELLNSVKTQLGKRQAIEREHETTMRQLRHNILYSLPHELRTPLAIILGNSELMVEDHDRLSQDDLLHMSEAIYKHSRRLYRLIENYLVYAQLEVVASDREQHEALRSNIVKDTAPIIEKQARQTAVAAGRGDDLEMTVSGVALRIAADDLRKIVTELVDNACKFSDPGTPIIVEASRDGDRYTFCVRDEGRGMSANQIRQIGAYMQFDRRMYEQQGLGLGLTVARRLVELHGGELKITSALGAGTSVCAHFALYE